MTPGNSGYLSDTSTLAISDVSLELQMPNSDWRKVSERLGLALTPWY
jgi:hypothetical protein